MPRKLTEAIERIFDEAGKSKGAITRILKPSASGAGTRIYPARTAKNDSKYGIRLDKGELVHGTTSTIRVHLQINSNASDKTLADLAKKNPHKVFASVDVDSAQEATLENLNILKNAFVEASKTS